MILKLCSTIGKDDIYILGSASKRITVVFGPGPGNFFSVLKEWTVFLQVAVDTKQLGLKNFSNCLFFFT